MFLTERYLHCFTDADREADLTVRPNTADVIASSSM
jgi:hypothetical protein